MARDQDSHRLILCLVADDEVLERFPAAIRFLQVGLIDEPVDIILVAPDRDRINTLISGPTKLVRFRKMRWPLARWGRRYVVDEVLGKVESISVSRQVLVHGLSLTVAPLAAAIADASEADLVLNVSSALAFNNRDLVHYLSQAAAVIAPAHEVQDALAASAMTSCNAEVVPFGAAADETPAAFRSRHTAPTLVYAGALSLEAGVDDMLRAVQRVLERHPRLQTFLLGRGPGEPVLRRLSASLGIADQVTYAGRVDHLRVALRGADVYCLPRALPVFREEPVHALAAGVAIVAAHGSMMDGLVHRQTAMLFANRDVFEMAEQITALLDDPDFARTLAAAGQSYARSHHSVSGMVSEYLRIYRRLANRHHTLPLSASGQRVRGR